MAVQLPKRVKPIVDFAGQIVIGATAFAVVFLVAVMLAVAIKFVERFVVLPGWLVQSVDDVEVAIWGIDLLGLALFLLKEVATLARKLWDGWKNGDG